MTEPTKEASSELSVKLIEKSCMSHLFRHASEITRETKGGYLEGRIVIPNNVTFPVYLRLSLIPSDPRFRSSCTLFTFVQLWPSSNNINLKRMASPLSLCAYLRIDQVFLCEY